MIRKLPVKNFDAEQFENCLKQVIDSSVDIAPSLPKKLVSLSKPPVANTSNTKNTTNTTATTNDINTEKEESKSNTCIEIPVPLRHEAFHIDHFITGKLR